MTARSMILMLMVGLAIAGQAKETPHSTNQSDGLNNTVLAGATFTTMNPAQPNAEALAFNEHGKIIAVGNEAAVMALAGPEAQIIDLGGTYVVPGFHDVHLHAIEAGINDGRCILTANTSLEETSEEINNCLQEQAATSWFIGAGISLPDLMEKTEMPVRVLDELIPDRPALILDNLGHGAWANSAALAAVGYDQLIGDPPGGLVSRNANGQPDGIVLENAQQRLRTAALPPTTANKDANFEALRKMLPVLAENGITSVSDAGGYWTRGHHEAWLRAQAQGVLTVRASNALYVFPDRPFAQQVTDIAALQLIDPKSLVRFDQVKIYVDGILSLGTAALYEPYTSDPGVANVSNRGFEYFKPNDLFDYAVAFDAAGFALHFHVAGDRGAGLALDAIEHARTRNKSVNPRHRLTHLFLVDERDRPRFAELETTADLQMSPSSLDPEYTKFLRTIIGKRADQRLPAASLLAASAKMTLSSDWDADELSPLIKIEKAVTRANEAIPDVATALRLLTIAPAQLLGHADITGSLEVGKYADLVVLGKNLLTIPATQIGRTPVIATLLAGEAVFDPDGLLE